MFKRIVLWDLSKPVRKRHSKLCGPYYFEPGKPVCGVHPGIGGYLCRRFGTYELREGSNTRLRIEFARDILKGTRQADTIGYYTDESQSETMKPVIARLPRSRGFLAGWTLGENMSTSFDGHIWDDIESAAYGAYSEAEQAAEREREYQARWFAAQECFDKRTEITTIRRDALDLAAFARLHGKAWIRLSLLPEDAKRVIAKELTKARAQIAALRDEIAELTAAHDLDSFEY